MSADECEYCGKDTRRIYVAWDSVTLDWAAVVPSPNGTCIGHGRTPVLALQRALRMVGQAAHEKLVRG